MDLTRFVQVAYELVDLYRTHNSDDTQYSVSFLNHIYGGTIDVYPTYLKSGSG